MMMPRLDPILLRLHPQRLLRQSLHDIIEQEAQDVDDVVVGFAVGDDAETGPLAEPFGFFVGEGCLAAFAVVDVFVLGHAFCALVGLLEAFEGGGVGFFFFFVVFVVFAFGELFAEEAGDVPREFYLFFAAFGEFADGGCGATWWEFQISTIFRRDDCNNFYILDLKSSISSFAIV